MAYMFPGEGKRSQTMHHTLGLYGKHQHGIIHTYIALARLTRIPLVGSAVRWVANAYGRLGHSGYSLSLQEAERIVDLAKSVAIGPCSCREEFHNCINPVMSEIVLSSGSSKVYADRKDEFRPVSKEEAKNILRQARKNNLVQSIMRCGENYYAICSCCTCCCVPLRLRNKFGIGRALVRNPQVVEDFQRQAALITFCYFRSHFFNIPSFNPRRTASVLEDTSSLL